MLYFKFFLMNAAIKKITKYPNEPPPDELLFSGVTAGGVVVCVAITASVIFSLVDKPFESVAVKDSVILSALAGATKVVVKLSALVNVMLVPDVCCQT